MTHFLDWFDAAGKLWTQEMVPGCFRLAETGIDVVQPGLPAAGPGGRDVIELNYQGGGWTFTALAGVPGMVAMGTANRAEAPVRSNGAEGLTHLMELRAGGQWYRDRRVPAFPLSGGQPCGSVDLAALRGRILVVGRKSEEGAPADSPPEGEARLRLELADAQHHLAFLPVDFHGSRSRSEDAARGATRKRGR